MFRTPVSFSVSIFKRLELNHSAFWVEFIVRHQEVPHARSGADHLNIIQYFLIDVIAFIISVLVLIAIVVYYLLKLLVKTLIYLICLPLKLLGSPKSDVVKSNTVKNRNNGESPKKEKVSLLEKKKK